MTKRATLIEEQIVDIEKNTNENRIRNYYRIEAELLLELLLKSLAPINTDLERIIDEQASELSKKMTNALGSDELLSPAQIKDIAKKHKVMLGSNVRDYVVKQLGDSNRENVYKLCKGLLTWFSNNVGINPNALTKRLVKDFDEPTQDQNKRTTPALPPKTQAKKKSSKRKNK